MRNLQSTRPVFGWDLNYANMGDERWTNSASTLYSQGAFVWIEQWFGGRVILKTAKPVSMLPHDNIPVHTHIHFFKFALPVQLTSPPSSSLTIQHTTSISHLNSIAQIPNSTPLKTVPNHPPEPPQSLAQKHQSSSPTPDSPSSQPSKKPTQTDSPPSPLPHPSPDSGR
jgi:hypothetical protein